MGWESIPEATLRAKLGKYKAGKGCLYLRCLSDVDLATLEKLIREAFRERRKTST